MCDNYYTDHRVLARSRWYTSFDPKDMTVLTTLWDDEGNETVQVVPVQYRVCPTCNGQGSHVNPSVDAGGLTSEDLDDWDLDDREAYFDGAYDVTCYGCDGKRVVPEISDMCDPELKQRIEDYMKEKAYTEAEYAAERRMGA